MRLAPGRNTLNTVAARLGKWSSALTFDALEAPVLDAARRCIVDVLGVSLAGAIEPTVRLIQTHVASEYAEGPCVMLGTDVRVAPTGAAFANGTAAHVLDYDDTCYAGIVHASAVVWPAVFAASELVNASGADAVVAFVAGCEVEYAMGQALQDVSYEKGWWNTSLLGQIGAAVGAARVLGLTPVQTINAVAIAMSGANGMRCINGTPVKPYLCGWAAQTGLSAALCARAGISGPMMAAEHRYGLVSLVNDGVLRSEALDGLGETYALIQPGVAIKLFPVCSAAQAAMQATLELIVEHDVAADEIEHVHCDVTPLVEISLVYDCPGTVTECQFSMPFAIGCILLFRRLDPDMLNESTLQGTPMQEIMRRVSMRGVETLSESEEQRRDYPEGAIVTITLRDGTRMCRQLGAATGMPVNPMSQSRLREKFLACASRVLTCRNAQSLYERLIVLDELNTMKTLTAGF